MRTNDNERYFQGVLPTLVVSITFILTGFWVALVFRNTIVAVLFVSLTLGISAILNWQLGNKSWLKHNQGADIVATNNVLVLSVGTLLSLYFWMLAVSNLFLLILSRFVNPWLWIIEFFVQFTLIGFHIYYLIKSGKLIVFITRTMDGWYFQGKLRMKLFLEVFSVYGVAGPLFWFIKHKLRLVKILDFEIPSL